MIVTNFDGLNINLAFPAYEVKALRALLQQVDNNPKALHAASHSMLMDGHPFTAEDVQAVARQFIVSLRVLATKIHEKEDTPEGESEARPN